MSSVWPMMTQPTDDRMLRNEDSSSPTSKPGIDSSLSSVPPEWPSARPEIIGTFSPASRRERRDDERRLVADAPVLCLSTFVPGTSSRSRIVPLRSMISVRARVSSRVMPFTATAMRKAETW